MSIVVNSNLLATLSPHNLSCTNDSLRKSLARLSLGKRITSSSDDSGGLSVAAKISSRISRTNSTIQNYKNALSYIRAVDTNLSATGNIVGRMAELRRMAQDVTKNSADVKNYSEEFIELQSQLNQISNDSFFGKRLFASHNAGRFNSGLKLGTTSLGSAEYNIFSVALTTHDFGNSDSGSVSINVVNFQFMLSLGSLTKNGTGHFYNLANIERANGTTGVNADGYIDDVLNVSVSQFIDIMERITDVRAENGAEQNRVIQRINLLQSNLTNIEAAHARIIHKDTLLKSSRLTRHDILAQECASKNTTVNQLTKAALSLTA